jgi:hypothetical protein
MECLSFVERGDFDFESPTSSDNSCILHKDDKTNMRFVSDCENASGRGRVFSPLETQDSVQ